MIAWLGQAFALASVISFSFASVAVSKAAQNGRRGGGALLSVVMTAVIAGAIWLLTEIGDTLASPTGEMWKGLAWFAVSGLLTTAAGRSLYFVSVRDLGAVRATAMKRVTPLFSVLLAVVILGEMLAHRTAMGLLMVAASIFLLFGESLALARRRRRLSDQPGEPEFLFWRGYGSGALSGFSYAAGYIVRKIGLVALPNGLFGTFVGAMTALAYYAIVAIARPDQRAILKAELRLHNAWHVLAALAISLGQICVFAALQFTTVTRLAVISSLEVFITMVLSVFIFRSDAMPGLVTWIATILATVGVIVIVL